MHSILFIYNVFLTVKQFHCSVWQPVNGLSLPWQLVNLVMNDVLKYIAIVQNESISYNMTQKYNACNSFISCVMISPKGCNELWWRETWGSAETDQRVECTDWISVSDGPKWHNVVLWQFQQAESATPCYR